MWLTAESLQRCRIARLMVLAVLISRCHRFQCQLEAPCNEPMISPPVQPLQLLAQPALAPLLAPVSPPVRPPNVKGFEFGKHKKGDFFISFGGSWDKDSNFSRQKSKTPSGALTALIEQLGATRRQKALRKQARLEAPVVTSIPQLTPSVLAPPPVVGPPQLEPPPETPPTTDDASPTNVCDFGTSDSMHAPLSAGCQQDLIDALNTIAQLRASEQATSSGHGDQGGLARLNSQSGQSTALSGSTSLQEPPKPQQEGQAAEEGIPFSGWGSHRQWGGILAPSQSGAALGTNLVNYIEKNLVEQVVAAAASNAGDGKTQAKRSTARERRAYRRAAHMTSPAF